MSFGKYFISIFGFQDNKSEQKQEQDKGQEQKRDQEQEKEQEQNQEQEQESDPYRLLQERFGGRRKRFRSNQEGDRIKETERERNTVQERERNTVQERERNTVQERKRNTVQERERSMEKQDPFHKYFSEERNEPSFARLIADDWEDEKEGERGKNMEVAGEKIMTNERIETKQNGFRSWETEKELWEDGELEKKEEERKRIEAWEEMRKNMEKEINIIKILAFFNILKSLFLVFSFQILM